MLTETERVRLHLALSGAVDREDREAALALELRLREDMRARVAAVRSRRMEVVARFHEKL